MSTQKLVMAFVTLIIGVALIGVVATQGDGVTTRDVTRNESFNTAGQFRPEANGSMINLTHTQGLTNAYSSTDWQWNDCAITVTLFALDNGTAATDGTDYNVTSNGIVALYNTTFWWEAATQADISNTTLVTYQFCQDEYMTGWSASILDLVPGFFAIALLMVSLALFYSIAKDSGII